MKRNEKKWKEMKRKEKERKEAFSYRGQSSQHKVNQGSFSKTYNFWFVKLRMLEKDRRNKNTKPAMLHLPDHQKIQAWWRCDTNTRQHPVPCLFMNFEVNRVTFAIFVFDKAAKMHLHLLHLRYLQLIRYRNTVPSHDSLSVDRRKQTSKAEHTRHEHRGTYTYSQQWASEDFWASHCHITAHR